MNGQAGQPGGSQTVFLTGGTGFIGRRLARRLAEHGHPLRCLVRASSDTRHLEQLGATLIEGDVTDARAMREGLTGADLAYHLAAVYDIGPVDANRMRRTNIEGTATFMTAALDAAVQRAVYASTSIVYGSVQGRGEDGPPPAAEWPDEEARIATHFSSVYQETKASAHRLALQAAEQGLPLAIAAPAFVYGPGDTGPVGRLVEDTVHGRLPALPRRSAWFSFVYVDDVADALARLGAPGDVGGTYLLGGEAAALHDFIGRIARSAGRTPPRLRLPTPLVRATGALLDRVSRVSGRRFSISREGVDQTTRGFWLYSDERARRAIGWAPRPLDSGVPPTAAAALQPAHSLQEA